MSDIKNQADASLISTWFVCSCQNPLCKQAWITWMLFFLHNVTQWCVTAGDSQHKRAEEVIELYLVDRLERYIRVCFNTEQHKKYVRLYHQIMFIESTISLLNDKETTEKPSTIMTVWGVFSHHTSSSNLAWGELNHSKDTETMLMDIIDLWHDTYKDWCNYIINGDRWLASR